VSGVAASVFARAVASSLRAVFVGIVLSAGAAWCALPAAAQQLNRLAGEVVGLADGDTVTVLDAERTQHKIRLAGIDAPEKSQPFGNRSRQHLADLVLRQQVAVEWTKRDRYGRIVGKVLVRGKDVCLAQVAAGLAWHYKAYVWEQSAEDQAEYLAAETLARSRQQGLWREPEPMAPWDFRRARRPSN